MELLKPIRAAAERASDRKGEVSIHTWEENDVAGRFIRDPIVEQIRSSDAFYADVTFYNFNVFYEIGMAVAMKKPICLFRNASLIGDDKSKDRISLLDSVGYVTYRNDTELEHELIKPRTLSTLWQHHKIDRDQPVYYLRTPNPVSFDTRTLSRLKKARIGFRIHDPEETGPLAMADALDNVAQSCGVVLHLLASVYDGARPHNMCMALVAGLAHGSGCETLILQAGTDPVPLDYRDLVTPWTKEEHIEQIIGEFAPEIYGRAYQSNKASAAAPLTGLRRLNLGASAAENEFADLGNYFLETDQFLRIMRGEIQVAVGRKGSGKTAMFSQVRNRIRRDRKNVVLDLQPEGAQLLKIKDILLELLSAGTKEHTITAFWEYLLLLELCHKLLYNDKQVHVTNHSLYEPYRALDRAYGSYELVREGDFAERMLALIDVISGSFEKLVSDLKASQTLTRDQITQLMYKHDIHQLRSTLVNYLRLKENVWILFDNLDKGWSPYGVTSDDILLLRCLQEALGKLRNDMGRQEIPCRSTVFLRNDIYSLVVDQTPDRGKTSVVLIDWDDPELLRELLRRRIIYSLQLPTDTKFVEAWNKICVSHHNNEESSQYLIDRSLMRPRALIDLTQRCLSHAVNVGRDRIGSEDIVAGEHAYSSSMVDQVGYELRDVLPDAEDVLYAFIGCKGVITYAELDDTVASHKDGINTERVIDLLLWYGVVGLIHQESTEPTYIYNVRYDLKRLRAMIAKGKISGDAVFCINPGFVMGLDITN